MDALSLYWGPWENLVSISGYFFRDSSICPSRAPVWIYQECSFTLRALIIPRMQAKLRPCGSIVDRAFLSFLSMVAALVRQQRRLGHPW